MELRKYKATDDQILNILQKQKLWLRDTDNLVKKLDPASLNDLLEGRINRLAALKLADIDDLSEREEIRENANSIAEVIGHSFNIHFAIAFVDVNVVRPLNVKVLTDIAHVRIVLI